MSIYINTNFGAEDDTGESVSPEPETGGSYTGRRNKPLDRSIYGNYVGKICKFIYTIRHSEIVEETCVQCCMQSDVLKTKVLSWYKIKRSYIYSLVEWKECERDGIPYYFIVSADNRGRLQIKLFIFLRWMTLIRLIVSNLDNHISLWFFLHWVILYSVIWRFMDLCKTRMSVCWSTYKKQDFFAYR